MSAVSIPVRVLDVLKRTILKSGSMVLYSVSIPVRVLDVLKLQDTINFPIRNFCFNPCKGFRCFEAESLVELGKVSVTFQSL